MTRTFFEEIFLFLLPFAVFATWLAVRRRSPLHLPHWSGQVPWLVIVGLVLALGYVVWTGITAPRGTGPYVPAHMENGKFVPGKIE